jgi:hypothetical protein
MKERHLEGRRRAQFDRRSGKERRRGERRLIPMSTAALKGRKERRKGERRSGKERRGRPQLIRQVVRQPRGFGGHP